MVVPALIYVALNWNTPATLRGWAIPAASRAARMAYTAPMSLLGVASRNEPYRQLCQSADAKALAPLDLLHLGCETNIGIAREDAF